MDYQSLIIEDTIHGAKYLEVRLVAERHGLYGTHRFLAARDGRAYWWVIVPCPGGHGFLQRLISFASWDALEAEMGDYLHLPETMGTRIVMH